MSWFGYLSMTCHTLFVAGFLFIAYRRAGVWFTRKLLEYAVGSLSLVFGVIHLLSLAMIPGGFMPVKVHVDGVGATTSMIGTLFALYTVYNALLARKPKVRQ